ncbi:MAG: hypothetical protein DHS20C18_39270 [Saprospiraceae bacterium]|nr:MAG: hypothetical protein DHS20C18_39270 [Saprospiraceae bacterium]
MNIYGIKVLPFHWRYIWAGALILGVFQLIQLYTDYLINQFTFAFSWYFVCVKTFSAYFSWAMLAPLVYTLALEFWQCFRNPRWSRLLMLLGWSLVIVLLQVVLRTLITDVFGYFKLGYIQTWWHEARLVSFSARLFSGLSQYVIFTGFFIGFLVYQRSLQQEKELAQARLDALLMQLHPHFLFNTLHSIAALIDWDAPAAQKMIVRLGDLLRQVLDNENRYYVTLGEEFRFLQNYLELEALRFEDRLKIDYDMAADTLEARVPNLILQPLVENAIKHGIAKKRGNTCLKISSCRKQIAGNAVLELVVSDNGAGFDAQQKTNGLGLENVHKRLKQQYKSDYYFDIRSAIGQGCTVLVRIPFEKITYDHQSNHSG